MADKEKIAKVRAEIKRLKEIAEYNLSHSKMDRGAWMQQASVCTNLLSFIGSMQEEHKKCMYSKDNYTDEDRKVLCDGCEEECKFNKKEEFASEDLEQAVNAYIGYAPEVDESPSTYGKRQAFKAGANWKEQMMAKAVDATVHIDAGGYPYIPQMELYDYDKDIPFAKEGEKVKVIVIKED